MIHHTRTSKAYEETMLQFRAGLQRQGLDLDSDPGAIALNAQAFAHGSTRGRQVKATTANLRLAILSSFYTYAKKLKFLDENPIDLLDREKVQDYVGAQALDTDDVSIRGHHSIRGTTYVKEATRGHWGAKWLRNAHFRLLFQHMMRDMGVLSAYV